MQTNPLRHLPSVNELLESPHLKNLVDKVSHNVVVTEVRSFLDGIRTDIQHKAADMNIPTPTEMAEHIANWIVTDQQPKLRPVINATGILLHTGLGRAPLAKEALDEIQAIAAGYASVEVDLETGERSQRVQSVERLILEIVGGEAAVVVNNNAGATLLTLAALAEDKEVIVSRGHLVEIGGSYRLPDVMEASHARLREVGTTNKTRIGDFQNAINELTGAVMSVHTSNYVIAGFAEQPTLAELVQLGRSHKLPVIHDIGSGALVDFSKYGLPGEPLPSDSLQEGADVVLFSGDKLLGGPQCGIVVGKKQLIAKIAKHPLSRALRVDKVTLAALAATLKLYRDPERAENAIPLLGMLNTSMDNLRNRAERLAPQIKELPNIESADVVESVTYLGGGTVPTQQLPTVCIAISPQGVQIDDLAGRLRVGDPAVFGRIHQGRLYLDLRSVLPNQDLQLLDALKKTDSQPAENESGQ